jgi:hypothetical protein
MWLLPLTMIFMVACSVPRGSGLVRSDEALRPQSAFHYDGSYHVMVRIGENPDEELLQDFRLWMEDHPWLAWRFYTDRVLGLRTAWESMVYTLADLRSMNIQPELIYRSIPEYPRRQPLAGRILVVEVSMVVGTYGLVEYAELANIRRSLYGDESTISTAINSEPPAWATSGLHELDLPYIEASLKNVAGYRFRPVMVDGEPVRFNVIVSFVYDADQLNRMAG